MKTYYQIESIPPQKYMQKFREAGRKYLHMHFSNNNKVIPVETFFIKI
jgi:hypothetical protein